ncbi:MAG: DNA gyrase subunit A [Candidatus Nealsonbacteria bacterium]
MGCFTKDTKVKLCDGRSLTFGELIKEKVKGKRHWTFAFNSKAKKIEIAEIKNPKLTRKNEEIIEVTLDNGEKIKCTLDHRFMLRNGNYKEARFLKPGDSLMPLYAKLYDGKEDKNLKGYEIIRQPVMEKWEFVHRLADEWNLENGIYEKKAGRIRHHKDFNKLNNNPDNILRIQWKDHWNYHKKIASQRHNNPDYVKKLAEGRKKWWSKKENRELRAQERAEMNKKMWKDPKYRMVWTEARRKMWKDPEYKDFMRKASSKNLKKLWEKKSFQKLLSCLKSVEMKRRWQDKEYRACKIKELRESALKMWQNPEYREHMSRLMKEKYNNPLLRIRQSKISKKLWKNSDYRQKVKDALKKMWQNPEHQAKYSKDYFKKMAKEMWKDPKIRELHREKARAQWQNPEFRKKIITGVTSSNYRRLKENPALMKELIQKAKASLHKKWRDPAYKEKVIKTKILRFVYALLNKHSKVNPETYEKERINNGVPKIENALSYFDNFSEILVEAQKRNHKVVKTKIFSKREDVYDLTIDTWHNFALAAGIFVHNSIDDPSEYAAMRYSEMRLSKEGEEMLKDISKDTVDFVDNYDGTRKEPLVVPSPLPQLLLNGCLGIAVGMATNIPPHNLNEVCDALIYLIDNPKSNTIDLFKFIKGPDFPLGGFMYDKKAIIEAYSQGKGPILTRGKAEIVESKKERLQILITEIPFQVQKSNLLEQLAKLVSEKRIEGIKDIRDESDKEGMRIVIELQRDVIAQRILNQLYKFTDLQRTFHLNILALVDGSQPKVLNLLDILTYFIAHRKEVVARRAKYELKKAKQRAHILEGLKKCLARIDAVIETIKKSKDREDAKKNLMKRFKLTEIQTNAILDTKLSALAKLERKRLEEELKELIEKIKELTAILKSPAKIKTIIKKELRQTKETFGDERRTKLVISKIDKISEEDLIPKEEAIITLTQGGYIKRIDPKAYKTQRRGGKGILGMKTVSDDIVEHFLIANTHDELLFFTDSGKVFKTLVYEIPKGSRVAKGRGLLNFLELSRHDKVLSIIPINKQDKNGEEAKYLAMATKKGIVKKTSLSEFKNVRRSGLIAISLRKGDLLEKVCKTSGDDEVILVTKKGMSVRFKEKDIRSMGRPAAGVTGIRLKKGDELIGMDVIAKETKEKKVKKYLLVVSENGYGKRTDIREYRLQKRGGTGIKTANITKKTGELIASKILNQKEEDLIAISRQAQVIRIKVDSISKQKRSTQGVRIMKLNPNDKVASVACI